MCIKMSGVSEDIFSKYVKATHAMFNSDNVARMLSSFDTLILTKEDLRGDEAALKQAIEIEKNDIQNKQQVTEMLASENKKLELEYLNLLKEKRLTEDNIQEKRNEKIPCREDEETLSKIGKTLRLYKDITNVRWDYSAPENLIKGYVCGHLKNYVHAFEIPLNDSEATERVWQEIENSSLKSHIHDSKGKENVTEENIISARQKK